MTADPNAILREAAHLIKAGQKNEANALLRDLLDNYPGNADAWYLFAAAAPTRDYAVRHLQRALSLNPDHARAQAALQKLQKRRSRRARPRRWRLVLVLLVVLVALIGLLVVLALTNGLL